MQSCGFSSNLQKMVIKILLTPKVIISFTILIIRRNHTNFEIISGYVVFVELGIKTLTYLPTEFLLNKHFANQGMER